MGCIPPSKALLHASHSLHEAEHNFAAMGGLKGKSPSVDWKQMLAYKDDVIGQNTKGIEFLFKKNKVDWLKGWGGQVPPAAGQVKVGDEVHNAKHIVIASGSEPSSLPGVEVDEKIVVTSTGGALALPKVPKKMVVIGAGVIGLEMGSVYKRLGAEVTVIEFLDDITPPGMDKDIQKTFQRTLKKQGMEFIMGAAVQKVETTKTKAKVHYKLRKDDSEAMVDADVVLVATGRRPFVDGLGLEAVGVKMTERGQIATDHWKTSVPGIWAIGDVTEGPMLAHKAEDEGMAVAESIAGQAGHVNYDVIPGVIYTSPEVASVGKTEQDLKAAGVDYKVGKFSFMGNGRAKAVFMGDGFVKILADKATDRVLGVHIMGGPAAGELIHEACVLMEYGGSAEDLARTCHAHPTFSEAVREAALACGDGGAIHA